VLAERAHWLTLEWPPKYAPELNEIRDHLGDLKSRYLPHQTFTELDRFDSAILDIFAQPNSH
jgi:hypothetical protein